MIGWSFLTMVVLMTLRPIRMSQRAPCSHHEQCAVDQRHKPDETNLATINMGIHHDLTTVIVSIRHTRQLVYRCLLIDATSSHISLVTYHLYIRRYLT